MTKAPAKTPTVTCYLNKSTGFYHANIYWGRGDRQRPSLRVRTEAKAAIAFETFKRDILPGLIAQHAIDAQAKAAEPVEPKTDPRIADLVNWYVDKHLAHLGRADSTIKKYGSQLENLVLWCKARGIGRVSQLTYARVNEFLDWMESFGAVKSPPRRGHSRLSRNNYKTVLRGFVNAAVEAEKVGESPVKKWFIAKEKTHPDTFALSPAELGTVLEVIGREAPQIRNVITFMAHTGTRPSDAIDLRWSQVIADESLARRRQVKTKNLATYSLNAEAMAAIEAERARRKDKAAHVFTNGAGTPYNYNALYHAFVRALSRAGHTVERDGRDRIINLKTLRHSYGTIMAHLGCPPFLLQRQMGHTRIETTLKYYHVDPAEGFKWAVKFLDALQGADTENH